MLPLLLAAALASAPPCRNDLALADPHLRVVRARGNGYDHEIVTVDVINRGNAGQPVGLRQRLELVVDGKVLGSQPVPALGPQRHYTASFRIRVPHEPNRKRIPATFRYVPDARQNGPHDDCDRANDLLTATL